jgi:large subunit ribosomal protein L23
VKREPHQIIQRPIITEKSTRLMDTDNKYVFRVDAAANKMEIGKAVERLFKVKVVSVTTMNVRGKPRRLRYGQEGKRSNWKKAIVKLKEGDSIDLF